MGLWFWTGQSKFYQFQVLNGGSMTDENWEIEVESVHMPVEGGTFLTIAKQEWDLDVGLWQNWVHKPVHQEEQGVLYRY